MENPKGRDAEREYRANTAAFGAFFVEGVLLPIWITGMYVVLLNGDVRGDCISCCGGNGKR